MSDVKLINRWAYDDKARQFSVAEAIDRAVDYDDQFIGLAQITNFIGQITEKLVAKGLLSVDDITGTDLLRAYERASDGLVITVDDYSKTLDF